MGQVLTHGYSVFQVTWMIEGFSGLKFSIPAGCISVGKFGNYLFIRLDLTRDILSTSGVMPTYPVRKVLVLFLFIYFFSVSVLYHLIIFGSF